LAGSSGPSGPTGPTGRTGRTDPRPRLAVAASAEFPDLRPDWPLLQDALAELGVVASTQVWTDPGVRWHEFALVVANGAWDNIHHPDAFLAWAERVAGVTRIVNEPHVLRWNVDKRYLAALAAAGVSTVPTTWIEPTAAQADAFAPAEFPEGEFVVKPAISGGAFETARYRPGEANAARDHILRLIGAGRTVMVQPYQAAVDTHGEVGLVFLEGRFSHAVAKGPLLRPGAGIQTNVWEHEEIGAVVPTEEQLTTARGALRAAERRLGATTYARVDLVTTDDGSTAVLELELLDPALFFETQPSTATAFAQVLRRLIP
jgi:O-ureido-D-serine cyclo-ligase